MIVLLTYYAAHRKTEDVLCRLVMSGHNPHVLATPWVARKPRTFIYAHRPHEDGWPCNPSCITETACKNMGLNYEVVRDLRQRLLDLGPEVVVIGGAGLLEPEIVLKHKVLNVHPGLLPFSRGLDALKWAIIEGKKVGVTAHLCDDRPDLGHRIEDRIVPVYRNDTFHSFAMRQYEYELDLIVPSLNAVLSGRGEFQSIEPGDTTSRRRIPKSIEADLLPAFERYKLIFA